MESEEDALLNEAIAGSKQALGKLLEMHGPYVRGRLRGGVPRRFQHLVSLDDVMQETYLDAWLGISGYVPRGNGSFRAWLEKAGRRNLADFIRALRCKKRGGDRFQVDPQPGDTAVALFDKLSASGSTPSRHVGMKEAGRRLKDAVKALPPLYRFIVQQIDLKRRAAERVAAKLHRDVQAVYRMRRRAHRMLCELLGRGSAYF